MNRMNISSFTPAVTKFIGAHWNADARDYTEFGAALAREDMARFGLREGTRQFLLAVIDRHVLSPYEWEDWLDIGTDTHEDVRADALAFWKWLTGGQPLR